MTPASATPRDARRSRRRNHARPWGGSGDRAAWLHRHDRWHRRFV